MFAYSGHKSIVSAVYCSAYLNENTNSNPRYLYQFLCTQIPTFHDVLKTFANNTQNVGNLDQTMHFLSLNKDKHIHFLSLHTDMTFAQHRTLPFARDGDRKTLQFKPTLRVRDL